MKDRIACIWKWFAQHHNIAHWYSCPSSYCSPSLNAIVLSYLCLFWHFLQICNWKLQRILYQSINFELPVGKVVLQKLLVFFGIWRIAIYSEERRDFRFLEVLFRYKLAKQQPFRWYYDFIQCILHQSWVSQRNGGGPNMNNNNDCNVEGKQSNCRKQSNSFSTTQKDISHVLGKSLNNNQ